MAAIDYLESIKSSYVVFHSLLEFVPKGGGGTDVVDLPRWLVDQAGLVRVDSNCSGPELVRRVFAALDLARTTHERLLQMLPDADAAALRLGPELAVGTLNETAMNGLALPVPKKYGRGWVIVQMMGNSSLLSYVASLALLHADPDLRGALSRAGEELSPIRSRWLARWAAIGNRRWSERLRRRHAVRWMATQLEMMLREHDELGTCRPPDVAREGSPVPLPGTPLRKDHPEDAPGVVGHLAREFIHLHECAHVVLAHDGVTGVSRPELELAADSWAATRLIECYPAEPLRSAAVLGATLFLETAKWLARITKQPSRDSHPAAETRLERLRAIWSETCGADSYPIRLSSMLSAEFARLWREAEPARGMPRVNPVEILVKVALHERKPELFFDQFPRWAFIGAPEPLCRALAEARLAAEAASLAAPDDPERSEALALLRWPYESARKIPDGRLSSFLERELALASEADPPRGENAGGRFAACDHLDTLDA